jgi:hypothetical protein
LIPGGWVGIVFVFALTAGLFSAAVLRLKMVTVINANRPSDTQFAYFGGPVGVRRIAHEYLAHEPSGSLHRYLWWANLVGFVGFVGLAVCLFKS